MSITRVPSLLEQSLKSNAGGTNPAVRTALDIYSKAQTDAKIAAIDLSLYATNTTVANISGGLDVRLDVVEASIPTFATTTLVNSISGALATDIANLDLSLTQLIAEECMLSSGISGASTGVYGYVNITINGVSYKLALVS